MTWIDITIVLLCLGLGLAGIISGFVRQAASWAGLALGFVLAAKYHPAARELLHLNLPNGNAVVSYIAVFVAVCVIVRLLGLLVERWVGNSSLSGTNRVAGGLAGFGKGILASVLLVVVLTAFMPRDYEPLRRSRLAPEALTVAGWLKGLLPEKVRDSFRRSATPPPPAAVRGTERKRAVEEAPPPAPQPKKRSRK